MNSAPQRKLPPLPRSDPPPPVPDRPKKPQSARYATNVFTCESTFQPVSPRAGSVKRSNVRLGERRNTITSTEDMLPNLEPKLRVPVKSSKKQRKSKSRSKRSKKRKKKESKEQFPVKICTPSGKQAVLRSKTNYSVQSFTEYCIQKLKKYDVDDDFILCTEDGAILDASCVLYQCDYITSCIEAQKTIPTLYLCPFAADRQSQRAKTFKAANKDEIALLVKEFPIAFLLPGGQNITMQVCTSLTVKEVKAKLCETVGEQKIALLLNHTAYEFRVYRRTDILLDPLHEIGDIPYIKECRNQSTIPKLVLVQKVHDPYTPQEKKNVVEVTSLVGRVMAVSDLIEGNNFRATMARLRYLERKRKREQNDLTTGDELVKSVYLAEENTIFPTTKKLMASVTFPLIKFKKTILLEEHQTADACLEFVFEKHYSKAFPDKKASDFVFKAAGVREFICGPYDFTKFEYIRRKHTKQEKIELVMFDRNDIIVPVEDETNEHFTQEWMQGGEEILDACNIQYRHEDVCGENTSWDEKTHISLWELSEEFRVKLIGVENISLYCQNFAKTLENQNHWLYISAGLYHGGELLVESLQVSERIPVQTNARWNSWFQFPIRMCNLPRACRICFTLYATTRSKTNFSKASSAIQRREDRSKQEIEDMKIDIPIAWVNCQLIQYNHELRMGRIAVRMWPDDRANPIGTCVPNSDVLAPSLHLRFDEYQLPVIFPTKPSISLPSMDVETIQMGEEGFNLMGILANLDKIFLKDPLYVPTHEEKKLLWKHRIYCSSNPRSLPKLLVSVPWHSRVCVQEMHRLLQEWEPLSPLDALQMLDSRFHDAKVRQFAVRCLESFRDADLQTYLLQLVQVLKYEPYHDSALARFLMQRALRCQRIGHVFFWYLKAEMHVPEISERYGLLLEAYLYGCGGYLAELSKQNEILNGLQSVANFIKNVPAVDRREVLIAKLKEIQLPEQFQLPIDPTWEAKGLLYERCKYMDSKKLPLWLEMRNADPTGMPIVVIFKSGDDLRQDMLTLQIIRVMDKLWKREGLDLQLSPYGCISTGDEVGMIEVVLNSTTTAAITREAGGATAAFKKAPIANWLSQFNRGNEYNLAVERFKKSCAGYCVATYVLGIGDRHNDNIMVQQNGRLFHIDFGHFLGNFKKKFGFSRERAKFVFTPDFAYVLGGVGSELFKEFVTLCCQAYNILRKNAGNFINLMAMMLSTGIPELQKASDIDYLRNTLCLDLEDEEASASFCKQISASLGCKTTIINNMIHILAH